MVKDQDRMNQETDVMPQLETIVAGRLDIGKEGPHQISSPLETNEQIAEYAERVGENIVSAEEPNCGVCMDGRGCRCLASDVTLSPETGESVLPDFKKPPVRMKLVGGTYDLATTTALLAGWSGLRDDTETYDDAWQQVSAFLKKEGIEDAIHTSDLSFDNPENTECGGFMKKELGMQKGAMVSFHSLESGEPSALDTAIAAYNGVDAAQLVQDSSVIGDESAEAVRRANRAIRERQKELVEKDVFGTFDPIAARDRMIEESPANVEYLYSDANHPTHNHKEPLLAVIDSEDETLTVDRDAMYEQDGFSPFVDNRNFRRRIARLMSGTDEEALRLLIAGDITTVDVSDELVAPGMPVVVYR